MPATASATVPLHSSTTTIGVSSSFPVDATLPQQRENQSKKRRPGRSDLSQMKGGLKGVENSIQKHMKRSLEVLEKSSTLVAEVHKRAKVTVCQTTIEDQVNQQEVQTSISLLVQTTELAFDAIRRLKQLIPFKDNHEKIAGISWTAPDYRQRNGLTLVNVGEGGEIVVDSVNMMLSAAFADTYSLPNGTKVFPLAFDDLPIPSQSRSSVRRSTFPFSDTDEAEGAHENEETDEENR